MSHEHNALEELGFWVITSSDTRTEKDDLSGQIIQDKLKEAGYSITGTAIVPDDKAAIETALSTALENPETDVIIITGGSGITSRDVTIEAVEPHLDKELPGFGELFRMLSYEEVGARALLSRATAGISHCKAVFCLPGSKKAVALAMDKLILPEIGHMLWEVRR